MKQSRFVCHRVPGSARLVLWIPCVTCVTCVTASLLSLGVAAAQLPSVAILIPDPYSNGPDVQEKLTSSGAFASVGIIDAVDGPPTLQTLQQYDAILMYTVSVFNNQTLLGNTLADYVDSGGGVVSMSYASAATYGPSGRWRTGYLVMPMDGGLTGVPDSLALDSITNPDHPILFGVQSFAAGAANWRVSQTEVVPGAEVIARWTSGAVLAAAGPLRGRVDLNFYPPSGDLQDGYWNTSTDGVALMANALKWTIRAACPGDFNADGFVDDSDFSLFAGYYDTLIDPRGDLNNDGLTDDADFVIFAEAYNALLCP